MTELTTRVHATAKFPGFRELERELAEEFEFEAPTIVRQDAMGNPVIDNPDDPKFNGIPTGPEAFEMSVNVEQKVKKEYPVFSGSEMPSPTDAPYLI